MRITNRFKKLFALFFVLAVVIPLSASFGIWDMISEGEDTFATGNDVVSENVKGVDVVSEEEPSLTPADTSSITYKFAQNVDEDLYDYSARYSFNGVEYKGVFKNDFKDEPDNTKLKVSDLGTMENPYVVLEITPTPSVSELRPHIADLNYFDMSQEEVDAIVLTDDEKRVVELQGLYQIATSVKAIELKTDWEKEVNEIEATAKVQYADEIQAKYVAYGWQYYQSPEQQQQVLEEVCKAHYPNYEKLKASVNALNVVKTVNNRVDDPTLTDGEEVDKLLVEIRAGLIEASLTTEEEYKKYVAGKMDYALNYKKNYYKSVTYNNMLTLANHKYNYEYITQYEVGEDGNFDFYKDGDTKTITTTSATETYKAITGEVKYTSKIINPLSFNQNMTHGDSNNKLLRHSNTFSKGCLDLAYNMVLSETGAVESQTPYIDEYVFAGWSIMLDGKMTNLNSLSDDFNLKENGITQLYTNWVVKYYEKDSYEVLTTAGYVEVPFSTGESTYTVMLPDCIASKQDGLHDFRNQLSMCVAKQNRVLTSWDGNKFRSISESEVISYSEEYSSWNFNFVINDYPTVATLKKVAPKLMADTDYYVATWNTIPADDNGVVTYYPYNVLVITITPEELNKMVYYDEAFRNKDSSVPYQQSAYLNRFLDSVDFVFFSNGGRSWEYSTATEKKINDLAFGKQVDFVRVPVKNRNPLLYTINDDDTVSYVKANVNTNSSYASNYEEIPDLEWQVVEKIYQRVAEPKDFAQSGKGQSRSMVVIFNEALGDNVSGKAGNGGVLVDESGEYTQNGSADNLCKLMHMFFVYRDPKVLYQKYVDKDYSEEMNGDPIKFDKMKGTVRTVALGDDGTYRGSSYTGVLYGYEKWNHSLFFPFEYFAPDYSTAYHVAALVSKGNGDENASEMFYPWNEGLYPIGYKMYNSLGLARNVTFKNIANPYAYTYNGGNSISSAFYSYIIPEIYNPTNSHEGNPIGNTDLAFEYFYKVNPFEIKNGCIATKSAIEFMVQNAHNASLVTNKSITILNKAEDRTRFIYSKPSGSGTYTVYVDTIIVEDFTAPAANIEYKYTNTDKGFFVPEILWTEQYSTVDNNFNGGAGWYTQYTNKTDGDPLKWYIMPNALDNANKNNYYITYNIENVEGTASDGTTQTIRNLTTNRALHSYADADGNTVKTNDPAIIPGHEYYVEALLKPIIDDETKNKRQYIVAVKQYNSYNDFKAGKEPENIVVKNVTMEKLTYLFNLD